VVFLQPNSVANIQIVSTKHAQHSCQRVYGLTRLFVCLIVCGWLTLVQPGLSYYWLIDPHVHAEIDADRYGQLPDGRMLPGHPYQPPHEHPSSGGIPATHPATLDNDASAYSSVISWEANRPSLQSRFTEAAVIPHAVFLDPPEHPPRA
jgi:hypothetical protein